MIIYAVENENIKTTMLVLVLKLDDDTKNENAHYSIRYYYDTHIVTRTYTTVLSFFCFLGGFFTNMTQNWIYTYSYQLPVNS
jgi:hypothetical protein